jgi:hypothetical protein
MFFEEDDLPDEVDIAVAILDNASELAPQMHIWASSRVPWAHVDDGLAVHAKRSTSPPVD